MRQFPRWTEHLYDSHTHSVPHQIIILLVLCRFFPFLLSFLLMSAFYMHICSVRSSVSTLSISMAGIAIQHEHTHSHFTNQISLCNFMKIRFYAKIWMRFAYFLRRSFVVFIWFTSTLRMLTTTHPICPVSVYIRLTLDELSYNPFDGVGNVMITSSLHSHALS